MATNANNVEESVEASSYGSTPGPVANTIIRIAAALELGAAVVAAVWISQTFDGEPAIAAAIAIIVQGTVTAALLMAFAAMGDNLIAIRHAMEGLAEDLTTERDHEHDGTRIHGP